MSSRVDELRAMSWDDRFEFFSDKVPNDVSDIQWAQGRISCYGFGRMMVDYLGGKINARIYEVKEEQIPNDPFALFQHVYVIPNNALGTDLALGHGYSGRDESVRTVKAAGVDVTDWVYEQAWSDL